MKNQLFDVVVKDQGHSDLILIQMNLVMSNSVYSKFFWSSILNLVLFNLIYLLLSQISMYRNFGYLEVVFQSLIYKCIQIMFAMSKLSIKSINKPVKVSTAWRDLFWYLLIIICKENNWIFLIEVFKW